MNSDKNQLEFQGCGQAMRAKSQLLLLFTYQNVNNKITTTTENLPILGIFTDILSDFVVFVESRPNYFPNDLGLWHTTWQDVLIQIKSPNNLDTWNVVWTPKTTFWHNESNETLGPF